MNSITQVSELLFAAMRKKEMTQKHLREISGLSRQTMSNVLHGKEDYKLSTLLAVADKLGLELVLMPKVAAQGLQDDAPAVETLLDRARKQVARTSPSGKTV